MFKGSIEQRRLNKQQARGVLSRACIFVWDTDLQNDEDENIGISQVCNSKKVGISPKTEGQKLGISQV